MKFLSVCSGIEAASSAWASLGWEAVAFSEIEPFPCAVLAHHYPTVPNYGDMTKLPARIASGEVVAPDVFCGGTPCQAFSVAGLRLSLDDARGNLSLTFCEIANAIDTVRAGRGDPEAIVFWENVPGVLSTADNAFGCFLSGLAGDDQPMVPEPRPATGKSSRYWKWSKKSGGHSLSWPIAGCVFGPSRAVAWRVLDAQYFGVAQRRRRVFVVASARKGFDPAAVLFEFDGVRRDTAPSREAGKVAPTIPARSLGGGGLGTDFDCDGGLIASGKAEGSTGLPFLTCSNIGKTVNNQTPLMAFETVGPLMTHHSPNGHGCAGVNNQQVAAGHIVPVLTFDTTQITSAANYSNPRQGDPCHPLNAGAHAPAIAFDCKSSGQNGFGVAVEVAGTLRAMGSSGSHSNGGGHQAVAYTTKLHNTTSNQSGKVYEEYTTSLDANSPPPVVFQPLPFDTTQITSAANRSVPRHGDPCHPLAAGAHPPAIAFTQGEQHGRMDGGTPQSQDDLPAGAVRDLRRCECGGTSQERGLEGSPTGEPSAPVQELSHEGASVGSPLPAVREAAQGAGLLRDALPATEAARRPGIQTDSTCLHCGGLRVTEPLNGVLREARTAGETGHSGDGSAHQERGGFAPMAVRRLTPVECERLQGFPDNWTLIPWRKKPADQCPDGPRYKALGNSWAVPVARWIGERIEAVESINSMKEAA